MAKVNVKGPIISNDWKEVYSWFGYEATCPKDIEDALEAANGEDLEIHINSGGGDVFAGSEIYTLLKSYRGNTVGKIMGLAASAASVIGMGCKQLLIAPTAQIMIHNVSSGARGDYRDMQHSADVLKNWNVSIANSYQLKTGLPQDTLLKLMNKESWMNAKEALDNKFVDQIMFDTSNQLAASAVENDDSIIPPKILEKLKNSGLLKGMNLSNNTTTLPKGDEPMNFEAIMASLPEDQRQVVTAAIEEAKNTMRADVTTELTNKFAEEKTGLENQITDLKGQITTQPQTGDILDSITDETVRAHIIAERAKSATAEAELAKLQNKQELDSFTAIANKFDRLPINSVEFGPVFQNFAKADKEGFEKLEALLTAANNCIEAGKLFNTAGTTTSTDGMSAWDQFDAMAKELVKNNVGMAYGNALSQVMKDNPELYNQYKEEMSNDGEGQE